MDSLAPTEGYLIDIIDAEWRVDKLPDDEILLPLDKLPDLETDQDQTSLKEQEEKWLDLALSALAPEISTSDFLNNSNS